jgi:hypothetical protein
METLKEIDRLLVAKPFVPFVIRCGKNDFQIRKRKHARFNNNGGLEIRQNGQVHWLNSDHVSLA